MNGDPIFFGAVIMVTELFIHSVVEGYSIVEALHTVKG